MRRSGLTRVVGAYPGGQERWAKEGSRDSKAASVAVMREESCYGKGPLLALQQ